MTSLKPSQAPTVRQYTKQQYCNIFPNAEKLLAQIEYQEALYHVAGSKLVDGYLSFIDFLFCELFIDYRPRCASYYEDQSPSLKELPEVTEEQIALWDAELCVALLVAYEIMRQDKHVTWSSFRTFILFDSKRT